jgi:hypothetical protein
MDVWQAAPVLVRSMPFAGRVFVGAASCSADVCLPVKAVWRNRPFPQRKSTFQRQVSSGCFVSTAKKNALFHVFHMPYYYY